jgi:hypothetical protein
MSRRLKLALALVLVTAAAVAASVIATRGGASRDSAKLSNHGRPIGIRAPQYKRAGFKTGSVLAVRGDRVLYRLTLVNGDPCFGAGPESRLGTPGSVICPAGGFPRAGSPILDLSVYEGTRRGVRDFSLYRAEGFAADGIAAVRFFRPNGEVALTVPVSGNVYSTASVPKGPIWGIAAVDKDGKEVWRGP